MRKLTASGSFLTLFIAAQLFPDQADGPVLALFKGAAHVFADDTDAQKLHGTQSQDQHDDGSIARNVDA